jgi:two-component system sensor histidine kinase AtoS
MAESWKSWFFRGRRLWFANVFLAVLMLLTFTMSLLLYRGLVSTRKSLDMLVADHLSHPVLVDDLDRYYARERTLELGLIALSACMGVTLFIIYLYLIRVSRTLGEVQTIDRDILNSITQGIVTVDLHGNITSCNRAAQQIFGVRAIDLFGRPIEELIPREDPLFVLLEESFQKESEPREIDLEYALRSRRVMPLRVTTFALRNQSGKRVGGILLLKDMTEIRKMEERIQRDSRLAALGELTQRLVHEIRNPLSAMDINLQLLQERLARHGENAEIGRYISIITSETRRLNEVLRNAQSFAHPRPATLEPVDLHLVMSRVVFLLREEAMQKGVEITQSLLAEESRVLADVDQMEQVFINLFKNSIEAMARGGKLEITSRNTGDGKRIGVEILDTGPGIPMDSLQRIFDLYYTTKKKGTGLGLSIVHTIIGQHGGTIDVGSWLGEGTLFSITLPLADKAATANGDAKTENPHRR